MKIGKLIEIEPWDEKPMIYVPRQAAEEFILLGSAVTVGPLVVFLLLFFAERLHVWIYGTLPM